MSMYPISKIFNKNTIIKYKKVSDESNENVKKINMVNASLDLFKIEMNRALNNILKETIYKLLDNNSDRKYDIVDFYIKNKEYINLSEDIIIDDENNLVNNTDEDEINNSNNGS